MKTQLNSTFINDLKRKKKFRKMFIVADLVSLKIMIQVKNQLGKKVNKKKCLFFFFLLQVLNKLSGAQRLSW